ncbi:hypothetical protein ACIFOE_05015 [Paenibacillus sp. NRS-1783]|uniref:hypothetical protein n=1 Tax=Paenibacillus sp. NRS-1783 TaxID=3233907 RepID=UPI003D2DDC47
MVTNQVEASTRWIWTEKGVQESGQPDIEPGATLSYNLRKKAPRNWRDMGWIREAQPDEAEIGQAAWDFC